MGCDEELSYIGAQARQMWYHAPEGMREGLLSRFIKERKDVLHRAPPGVSWFTPEVFGGLGLPCSNLYDRLSDGQRRALYIAKKAEEVCPRTVKPSFQLSWKADRSASYEFLDVCDDPLDAAYKSVSADHSMFQNFTLGEKAVGEEAFKRWSQYNRDLLQRGLQLDFDPILVKRVIEDLQHTHYRVCTVQTDYKSTTVLTRLPFMDPLRSEFARVREEDMENVLKAQFDLFPLVEDPKDPTRMVADTGQWTVALYERWFRRARLPEEKMFIEFPRGVTREHFMLTEATPVEKLAPSLQLCNFLVVYHEWSRCL